MHNFFFLLYFLNSCSLEEKNKNILSSAFTWSPVLALGMKSLQLQGETSINVNYINIYLYINIYICFKYVLLFLYMIILKQMNKPSIKIHFIRLEIIY